MAGGNNNKGRGGGAGRGNNNNNNNNTPTGRGGRGNYRFKSSSSKLGLNKELEGNIFDLRGTFIGGSDEDDPNQESPIRRRALQRRHYG
jgi:hypothetical protein